MKATITTETSSHALNVTVGTAGNVYVNGRQVGTVWPATYSDGWVHSLNPRLTHRTRHAAATALVIAKRQAFLGQLAATGTRR